MYTTDFSCEPQTAGYKAHLSQVHLCSKEEKPGAEFLQVSQPGFEMLFRFGLSDQPTEDLTKNQMEAGECFAIAALFCQGLGLG